MLEQKSDTPRKNASSTKNSDTELNKSKRTLVKGPKPLQKLKFYLDIKNHAVTSKLEGKIKELGGTVEFFLDREVTHVISDRPECAENSSGAANSPATPRLRSLEAQYANESPLSACESPVTGRLRQKTRADAMLEKVRSQSATKARDPLQNAKLWGIPIWTVNKVFTWLERVTASITVSSAKSKKVKVISIASPFVKFEPITRNARPVYKTIKTWPTIDLESNAGKPAFIVKSHGSQNQPQDQNNISESNQKILRTDSKTTGKEQGVQPDFTNDSRMTRKQRTQLSVPGGKDQEDKQTLVGGYCEICHCEYREIGEHVRSEQHLNFVKNDANFLELDSLITAGANVEAFLRLNGNSGKELSSRYPLFGRRSLRKLNGKSSPEKEQCNGGLDPGYSPPVTRNKMPRTRSSNHSQHTPLPAHHLRSRGHVWNSPAEEDIKVKELSEGRPKRTCPKTKRISADERLVADNKTYYKVEVMTTKLRSSGLGTFSRETEVVRQTQTPIPEEPEEDEQSLVVKFRRVRRSELSVLNDEAENFMFPRKEDPSFSDADTDDGPDTTQSPTKTDPSSDIRSSESDKQISDTEDSLAESCETETPRRKRKRTDTSSQEETIETMSVDNFVNEIGLRRKTRKVYTEIEDQFDESSKDESLLEICETETGRRRTRRNVGEISEADNQRYQTIVTSTPVVNTEPATKNNGDSSTTQITDDEQATKAQTEEMKKELHREDLKFSFEHLPTSEPWYSTFRRQDSGEEFYTCVSDPADYCARFLLPYQLPFLIPLDPKVCIEDYLKKREEYLGPLDDEITAGTSDVGAIGEDSNSLGAVSAGTDSVDSSVASSSTETQKTEEVSKPGPGRRKKRKSRFIKLSSHPRKSPRQHASTLAILSSLIQQRKKRERKSQGESDTSRASLGPITEENSLNTSTISEEAERLQEQNAAELAKAVEDILSAPMDDISEPDILDSFEGVEIKHHPDAIELLQNFDTAESPPRGRGHCRRLLTPIGETVRVIRRRRKKNRTGWPKKKRLFIRRTEQKSEDGNGSLPELEDSRLTEIFMEEEHGELEMCELKAEGPSVNAETETRTNDTDSNSQQEDKSGDTNCETVQVKSEESEQVVAVIKEEPELIIEDNTIQGVLQCTERINNSVNNVKVEPSEIVTNIIEKINNVFAENINNNSFSDLKIKEECLTDSTSATSEQTLCAPELNNGVAEEIPKRIPYNVTILDCKKPQLKRNQRNSSSDCSVAEEVIASQNDRLGTCVNVTLDKWENAEKVLTAKVQDSEPGKLIQFQPFVRVQKIENSTVALQNANRRLRSSSSPERKPKAKRTRIVPPTSPRSPRKLRTPRGKWYRER